MKFILQCLLVFILSSLFASFIILYFQDYLM